MADPYSLALWQQWRAHPEAERSIIAGRPNSMTLPEISPDVPMDDETLTFWNGEKFENMAAWPAYAVEPGAATLDPLAVRLTAVCGTTPVELRRDGSRWLMWAGVPLKRRKDFASPYAEHAQRTAVFWYGEPVASWTEQEKLQRKPPKMETEPEP